jgi:hypothetical protein
LRTSKERVIRIADLHRFVDLLDQFVALGNLDTNVAQWRQLSNSMRAAPTADLRAPGWMFPPVRANWAEQLQRTGREQYGPAFRFVGYDLMQFGRSDPAGRERLENGDIRYAAQPNLGNEFIVFTGSMSKDLARYRLDLDYARAPVSSPFEDYRFEHPETQWFNIRNLLGAAKFFFKNAPQILDFYARIVASNISKGRRTLLVSRKKFVAFCRKGLTERLVSLGVEDAKIVTGNWDSHDLTNPKILPLIRYGVVGLNRFEDTETVLCLNSYYATPDAVSQSIQDIEASAHRYPVEIVSEGNPSRRRVKVAVPSN